MKSDNNKDENVINLIKTVHSMRSSLTCVRVIPWEMMSYLKALAVYSESALSAAGRRVLGLGNWFFFSGKQFQKHTNLFNLASLSCRPITADWFAFCLEEVEGTEKALKRARMVIITELTHI